MPQKILFISPVPHFKGGAERSLFDLLSNEDISPVLCAPEDGPVLEAARERGIACEVLDFGSINHIHRPFSFAKGMRAFGDLWKAICTLKGIARNHGVTVVHSNGLKAHMINCVAARVFGLKAVIHIRDIPYTKPEILVWKIMHALCHKMVLVSHACWPGESLPRKAVVVHNGTPLIDGDMSARIASDAALSVGFCGRIHPAKGLHLLVDWLAAARKKGHDARLSVRGSFSEDAPNYESEIQAQIKGYGLDEHVEFTGFINDAQALYAGLDVVVVPSKTPDPLPRSVMEAMARGIPVFGYPAGGIFEMIDDGETGYLVDGKEIFIAALEDLSSDAQKLEKMTRAAKAKIEAEFTIENLHSQMAAIYKSLV